MTKGEILGGGGKKDRLYLGFNKEFDVALDIFSRESSRTYTSNEISDIHIIAMKGFIEDMPDYGLQLELKRKYCATRRTTEEKLSELSVV